MRVDARSVEGETNCSVPHAPTIKEVQLEPLRQRLANPDAADAVSMRVEAREKDPDAELPREDGDDAAGDSALRRPNRTFRNCP